MLAPALAAAQPSPEAPTPREGTVLRIDGSQLVVDLGHAQGVETGSTFTLYRPLTVTHPVTRRVLRDRFPIGRIVLDHAGQTLSVAHAEGAFSRPPSAGDVVVPARVTPFRQEPSETPAPAPAPRPGTPPQGPAPLVAPPPTAPAAPEGPPEEREATALFVSTLGAAPEQRVQRYERFLRERPGSPYAPRIVAEVSALRALLVASRRAAAQEPARSAPDLRVLEDLPTSLRPGDPAVVVVQFAQESSIRHGALFVRRQGQSSYQSVAMRYEGDGYLRAEVHPSFVTPGTFEYFVEATPEDGRAVALLGSAVAPRPVEVLPPPEAPPAVAGRSRVDLRSEYADVGTRTVGGTLRVQRFITVEGDFLQRLSSPVLYGYRVGFGVYDGQALPLALVTSTDPSVHTRVIYGYHELEFAASPFVHLIARLQLGVFGTGLVVGAQARLRIGYERRTNILLGGDVFHEVGQRAFFAFNFAPTPKVPMMAQGEVFNQSVAAGDPMFRFIFQAGYRLADWCTLSLRGSYQLRNIQNGGFGLGLSTTFDW
ncbi:MAG: hypothetical protein HY909_25795 [Deltaproteobacteria bacterium]|nr:hypothetical protein [Deltaproteobacteria bacterium]